MTRTAADDAVDRYLDRLAQALKSVAPTRRDELVSEIIDHIVEARHELPDRDDETAVRNLLDRLGTPDEIAAAEREPGDHPGPAPADGGDLREKLAIVLLLVGGFFAGFGWLAGVVLLWLSPRWRDRDKLIGTLLIPGGLTTAFVLVAYVLGTSSMSSNACAATAAVLCEDDSSSIAPWLFLAAVATLLPLASAAHLLRRLRQAP